jgi:hypothetical protein
MMVEKKIIFVIKYKNLIKHIAHSNRFIRN